MSVLPLLEERLRQSLEQLKRTAWLVAREEREAQATLRRYVLETFASEESSVPTGSDQEVIQQIKVLVRSRRLSELSLKTAKIAASSPTAFSRDEMEVILNHHRTAWRTFVEGIFQRWDIYADRIVTEPVLLLALDAPDKFWPVASEISRNELLKKEAPELITPLILQETLLATGVRLTELGLRIRWHFTQSVVAHAFAHLVAREGLPKIWRQLEDLPEFSGRLLPQPKNENSPKFLAGAPTRIPGSIVAKAKTISTILTGGHRTIAQSFVPAVLESEFGDPRVGPTSQGWQLVKTIDASSYNSFLESLVREDLALFFEYAMHEVDRSRFWLRYVHAIRRTLCILTPKDHTRLASVLESSDENEVRAALSRVRQYRQGGGQLVSAFCLYFDSIVVVEFAYSGNAAYVYDRSIFEDETETKILRGNIRSQVDLKLPTGRIGRILHFSHWQSDALELLAKHGILRQ